MTRPARVGVFGAGKWGTNIVSALERFGEQVCTVRSVVRSGDDWRAALDPDELDLAIIATPPAFHVEMASAALERRIPVMVEKPVATSTADLRSLTDVASAHPEVPILVDYVYLFHPGFEELERRVASMSSPLEVETEGTNRGPFRRDVSALWDYGPHDVAMALRLFGANDVDVTSVAVEKGSEGGEIFDVEFDFGDAGTASLRFGNGDDRRRRRVSVRSGGERDTFEDVVDDRGYAASGSDRAARPLDRVLSAMLRAVRDESAPDDRFGLELTVRVTSLLETAERELEAE